MTTIEGKRNEERRKIQLTGRTTYTVSLPKKWILLNQLKKNSPLLIREEADGSLSIKPPTLNTQETPQEAYLRVSPKESPDALIRKTVSAYLVGYNLIHIEAQNQQQLSSKQRSSLKKFARNMLVGTETVTDSPTELTLQVLLSYPELPVENALRRMSIIAASMHRDSMTALEKLDHSLAQDVVRNDDDVDRFNRYVVRQLKMAIQNPRIINEIGLGNARDCLGYRLVTKSVERTADHAVRIAENIILLKKNLAPDTLKNILQMSQLAISTFENSIEALFRRDFEMAENSIQRIRTTLPIEKEAIAAAQKVGADEEANLRLIIESVRRTAEYAADIAEIVLNLTVETVISHRYAKT